MSDPWGHKVTVHIYIAGNAERAQLAAECVMGQVLVPGAQFVGIDVAVVEDEPNDQVAT